MNPPRHVLVVMDAEPPATPVEEIIARLPDLGEASPATPQILRLESVEPGRRNRTSDLTRLGVAVADLAERVREALRGDVQAELYLCGQAPLPLFVQLGQELSGWTGPITFFDRRPDLTWDEVQLSPSPSEEGLQFLDVVSGLDADLTAGRPVVFLSSRGVAPDAPDLSALFKALGEEPGPVVQARTSTFRSLRSADVAQAGRRLRQIVGALPTATAPLLLVSGAPALAFLLGRMLGEREAWLAAGADAVLKVPVVLRTSDFARPRIQVFIAHADPRSDETELHKDLARHIKACADPQGLQIEVFDKDSAPAGAYEKRALDALLEESDLIVPLLSADLIESQLGQAVTRLYGRGHPTIPVRERDFAVQYSAWKDTVLLPRGGGVLRGTGAQDTLLCMIASAVRLRAEELAAERARRDRDLWRPPWSSRPASTSAPQEQVLAEIERDLEADPLLRFTKGKREGIWLRLVDHLAQAHPEKKLKALLAAPTREQFAQLRHLSTETVEPENFLPSEPFGPLNLVLELLGDDAAAHWLYLGVVFVGPVLPFPHGSFQHWAVDLAERLRPYLPRLEAKAPAARRRLALAERLHRENCPGLLAVLVNGHHAPDEEIDLAVEILKHLRDHAPLREVLPDLAGLQSPAVLNLLGAYQQWRGDGSRARDAYRAARDRAFTDRDLIVEWVAVQGLRVSLSMMDGWTTSHKHEIQRLWQHKRDLEVRSPVVRKIEDRAEHTLRQAPRELAGRLCVNLAHDRPTQGPAFGVADHEIDGLLQDEEEMGLPPLRCRAAAELLGTIRLFQGGEHLRQAVALLCRYGSDGLGATLEKLLFFSPALRPEHPECAAIFRQILTVGRTASEWNAKLDFLQRYLLDLPLALMAQARAFYGGALQYFLHEAPRSGDEQWIVHVTGSTAPWALMGPVVEQLIYLAGLAPGGADELLEVLNRPEPACWQRALECLGLFSADHPLGPKENLNALGRRVRQLLEDQESCGLFAVVPGGRRGFLRDHAISPGLARMLVLLTRAGADRSLVEDLHHQLCGMLRHLLGQHREGMSALYQRSFFSEEVFGWLSAQDDAESQTLIREQLNVLLGDLERFSTRSDYFDRFGFFDRQVFEQLSGDDRRRLVLVLEQHKEELLRAAFERQYAARPMAWFAAAALAQDDGALWSPAREILAHSQPLPDLLAAVLSAPVARMGSLAASAEQALLHCLSGNTYDSMPWFDHARQRPATPSEESLLTAGFHGVFSYLDVNAAQEPAARWSAWLDPVLAQIYHKAPAVAVAALRALRLALTRVPTAVDQVRAAHALSWALAQPEREVRDAALEAALLHRVLLDRAAPGGRLAAALRRYDPPQTVSAASVWRRG